MCSNKRLCWNAFEYEEAINIIQRVHDIAKIMRFELQSGLYWNGFEQEGALNIMQSAHDLAKIMRFVVRHTYKFVSPTV